MSIRIEQLQLYLDEDPSDPFNLYALALEYRKADLSKAIALFCRLQTEHPDYVPTYYQLAQVYQQIGEIQKARLTYTEGITVAIRMKDLKAVQELRAARELVDG
jgi:predicted Zn-dependent protease